MPPEGGRRLPWKSLIARIRKAIWPGPVGRPDACSWATAGVVNRAGRASATARRSEVVMSIFPHIGAGRAVVPANGMLQEAGTM